MPSDRSLPDVIDCGWDRMDKRYHPTPPQPGCGDRTTQDNSNHPWPENDNRMPRPQMMFGRQPAYGYGGYPTGGQQTFDRLDSTWQPSEQNTWQTRVSNGLQTVGGWCRQGWQQMGAMAGQAVNTLNTQANGMGGVSFGGTPVANTYMSPAAVNPMGAAPGYTAQSYAAPPYSTQSYASSPYPMGGYGGSPVTFGSSGYAAASFSGMASSGVGGYSPVAFGGMASVSNPVSNMGFGSSMLGAQMSGGFGGLCPL